MSERRLAKTVFTEEAHRAFVELSGDRNPIHVDPVAARRTQAHGTVLHGVHVLLWALENLETPVGTVRARFHEMARPGETLELWQNAESGVLEVRDGDRTVLRCSVSSGEKVATPEALDVSWRELPSEPLDLGADQISGSAGRFALPWLASELSEWFPTLCSRWTPERVVGILATSALVGMICPGLHSVFGLLSFGITDADGSTELSFRVDRFEERFGLVKMKFFGPGVQGSIDAYLRPRAVAQPTMPELQGMVQPGSMDGCVALVVGGSRGLGELAAKLLALVGAEVCITYATGWDDAARVAAEINEAGGRASIAHLDVRESIYPQLGELGMPATGFTHMYYFATPPIVAAKPGVWNADLAALYERFYVEAFQELYNGLTQPGSVLNTMFYPSSEFVMKTPTGFEEYAAAKASGEGACESLQEDINGLAYKGPKIIIARLPMLATDQTAGRTLPSPLETVPILIDALSLVRRVD